MRRMPSFNRRFNFIVKRFLRYAFRTIVHSNDSPKQIAGGVALGVLIGFTPTMGCQSISAALIATMLRLSRIPAMAMVYITNPVTAVPFYGACYAVGVTLLRPFGFRPLGFHRIKGLFARPEDMGFWEGITEKLGEVFQLGWETLVPLWVGCLILGAVAAVIAYHVSLRFVLRHRLRKAERQARRARRRLERIRMEQALQQHHEPPEEGAGE